MMPSNTLFVATPKDRRLLNEEMVKSFKNGMEDGDVTIIASDVGVVLKAHKCVLSISKSLKGLFRSQEMSSLLNITIMIPGFSRESIVAILKFLYTGEVELVTGSDVTIEFSELCKIFQLNPPVNKYRNHTSKKAKSSLATSNPKYRPTSTAEVPEKPSENQGKSPTHERADRAPRPSGERHEKSPRHAAEKSDKVTRPPTIERSEKIPEKCPKSLEKVSEEEKQKDDHHGHKEKGEESLESSQNIAKETTEESSDPIQPDPIEPSPSKDSGVENTPEKKDADVENTPEKIQEVEEEEAAKTSFKMPDNFDLPDEFIMEGSSMPSYAKPSPIVGYASSPISSPVYGQEDSDPLAIEKSLKLPYASGSGEVKSLTAVDKSKKPLANLKSIFMESEAKMKADLQKKPSNSLEGISNPFPTKKQRVAHHESEKAIPVKSAKNELDEKRQRMMRKLRFEEEEKFDEKLDRKKSSKLLGIRLKRKSGGEYTSSTSVRSHGKRRKKSHKERSKQDCQGKQHYMAEDDDWLVDDVTSEESDQWIPSGDSEIESSGESEISISTSTSSEGGSEFRSEKERTKRKLKKIKKKKNKKLRRKDSEGYFETDEEVVTKAKDLIKSYSRERMFEEEKPTEISAERRDLNPGELSLLFEGKKRKRVRVKVDLHGQADIIDFNLYKLRLVNGSSSGETDTDVVDKEKSRSDEPGGLTIDEPTIKVKKLKKKKFNRIQMYNSSSEEDGDGKKEGGAAKIVLKRSVSEIPSPKSQDSSRNRHSSSGGSFTLSQASIARWKEDHQKKNVTSIKIRPYPPLQTPSSSSSSKGPLTTPPIKFSYGLSSENKALAEKGDPRQNLDSILKMSFKKKPSQNPPATDPVSDPPPSTSKPIVKPASVDNNSKVISSATNDTLKIIKPNSEADKLLQSLEQS